MEPEIKKEGVDLIEFSFKMVEDTLSHNIAEVINREVVVNMVVAIIKDVVVNKVVAISKEVNFLN